MLYYKMGNGTLIPVADRGVSKTEIEKLQKTTWARTQGGICAVVSYTEPHSIYFVNKNLLERR